MVEQEIVFSAFNGNTLRARKKVTRNIKKDDSAIKKNADPPQPQGLVQSILSPDVEPA